MARGAAARRYAKALFQLASESQSLDMVRNELSGMQELLEQNEELHAVLMQPLYPVAQRRAVLSALAESTGASPILRSFYGFLIDQRRLVDFDAIRAAFEELADGASGVTKALVRTATPLDDGQKNRLRAALARRSGGEVEMEIEVDPDLIGGVVAQVGDLLIDGSLRSQLVQLRAGLHRN